MTRARGRTCTRTRGGQGRRPEVFVYGLACHEEAVIADMCRHPFIVRLVDCFTIRGVPHLVYMHGGTDLKAMLAAGVPTPAQAMECMLYVAEGLGHLHDLGLLHADLKPANILVTDRGHDWTALLGDVGSVCEVFLDSSCRVQLTHCCGRWWSWCWCWC